MKTAVRILRGQHKGREGWISGTLEDRAARGITRAIVKGIPGGADLFATSSLEAVAQLDLDLPQPGPGATVDHNRRFVDRRWRPLVLRSGAAVPYT